MSRMVVTGVEGAIVAVLCMAYMTAPLWGVGLITWAILAVITH